MTPLISTELTSSTSKFKVNKLIESSNDATPTRLRHENRDLFPFKT